MSAQTLDILEAPLAYEEAMTTLFLPESGNILAKTIQVWRGGRWLMVIIIKFKLLNYLNYLII